MSHCRKSNRIPETVILFLKTTSFFHFFAYSIDKTVSRFYMENKTRVNIKSQTEQQSGWDNNLLKRLEERSCLRVSVYLISPALAYHAVYSLTLCVLSKQEYPGFSWIYFKVNQIIKFSFIAKNSLIWILCSECIWLCDFVLYSCFPSCVNQSVWVVAC